MNTMLDEVQKDEPECFDRIHCDPEVLSGKPCVNGTRISVQLILEWLADGASIGEIVRNYPSLDDEDVCQAVRFAASRMSAGHFA